MFLKARDSTKFSCGGRYYVRTERTHWHMYLSFKGHVLLFTFIKIKRYFRFDSFRIIKIVLGEFSLFHQNLLCTFTIHVFLFELRYVL